MQLLKWMAIGFGGLILALCGLGFFLPDASQMERSVLIKAKPETVFGVLNSFARFNDWSPWAGLDPNASNTLSGPASGVGAKQAWAGNDQVGTGSQEILESLPNERIVIKLVFGDFTSENRATYTLRAEGEGTVVSWAYSSDAGGNLLYRYFGLMTDSMLGPDYERGLAQLKTLIETLPPSPAAAPAAVEAPPASIELMPNM